MIDIFGAMKRRALYRYIVAGLLYPNVQVSKERADVSVPHGRVDVRISGFGLRYCVTLRDQRLYPYAPDMGAAANGCNRKIGEASFRAWEVTAWGHGASDGDE